MTWIVKDENGIRYHRKGRDGGKTDVLGKGSTISQGDIDDGKFTEGGIERLLKDGRLEVKGKEAKAKKDPETSNKKMPESKGG